MGNASIKPSMIYDIYRVYYANVIDTRSLVFTKSIIS